MRTGNAAARLTLIAGFGAWTGYAQPSFALPPEPTAQTRALAADWARMGRMAEKRTTRRRTVARASAAKPVTSELAIAPIDSSKRDQIASSSGKAVADVPVEQPKRRTLWDKQPWEIELDKQVRAICRGC
jgi:hypothetical protein